MVADAVYPTSWGDLFDQCHVYEQLPLHSLPDVLPRMCQAQTSAIVLLPSVPISWQSSSVAPDFETGNGDPPVLALTCPSSSSGAAETLSQDPVTPGHLAGGDTSSVTARAGVSQGLEMDPTWTCCHLAAPSCVPRVLLGVTAIIPKNPSRARLKVTDCSNIYSCTNNYKTWMPHCFPQHQAPQNPSHSQREAEEWIPAKAQHLNTPYLGAFPRSTSLLLRN